MVTSVNLRRCNSFLRGDQGKVPTRGEIAALGVTGRSSLPLARIRETFSLRGRVPARKEKIVARKKKGESWPRISVEREEDGKTTGIIQLGNIFLSRRRGRQKGGRER